MVVNLNFYFISQTNIRISKNAAEHGLSFRIFGQTGGLEWHQEEPNRLVYRKREGFEEIVTRRKDSLVVDAARQVTGQSVISRERLGLGSWKHRRIFYIFPKWNETKHWLVKVLSAYTW